MTFNVRPIREDEFLPFMTTDSNAFGEQLDVESAERFKPLLEFDRSLAAFDGERIVGCAGAISFQLTLPGCTVAPAAGVTLVGVLPTHRRRGILTKIMSRQLQDVRARGEPLAILLASESSIYGRFGYGHATTQSDFVMDPTRIGFALPESTGELTLIDKDEAKVVLPDVYECMRRQQPGAVNRSPAYWDRQMLDLERWRDGASARFYLIFRSPTGSIDGYASYRIKDNWDHNMPNNSLRVTELMSLTSDAYRALWGFCLSVDLVREVQVWNRPLDEPLRWMLTDQRHVRITEAHDFVWARLVDIPAALTARRYQTEDRLTFGVTDRFMPDNSGVYALEGGPEGAQARRGNGQPDLELEVADLAAAYLGGVGFGTLARAGRVRECTPGALRRATSMFASEPAAWCATDF